MEVGEQQYGIHAANLGNEVTMWAHSDEEYRQINENRKTKYLPNAIIPETIKCTKSLEEAIKNSELIFHVTPSKYTRETMKKYKQYITDQPVIICSKGFEASTLYTLSEVATDEMPNAKIGVFSGPSHAEEVSVGIPTAIVIASKYIDVLYNVQDALMDENLRIYTSTDVKGVELGGALKNIMAFCAGIAAELKLGDNTFAALITRGLTEISRLGVAMGGNHNTFYGLSGLGDLIVTCLSEHSRNRRAGKCIGRGLTVEETRKEIGMVVESFDNIEVTYKLSKKYNIEMPIVNTVYDILYNGLEPAKAVKLLMTREKKSE
ncbi:MAG: NAD(P)H-dependent glycerol-3-phosphate dehydrogenase [Clostridia bacterium]|nr:glycerol-3-phosphate dehydrogenase [NAD(P)+] [Clostridium sp. CAG:798]